MEICLGTVQFGTKYGLSNSKKPSRSSSIEILEYAASNGVLSFDTAAAYGDAEIILGEFLGSHRGSRNPFPRDKVEIISKAPSELLNNTKPTDYYSVIKKAFEKSARRMRTDYLDGYLFHSSTYIFEESMLEALDRLKKEGYVLKTGVSVYEIEEMVQGFKSPFVDIMQIPFSIFDQRAINCGCLRRKRELFPQTFEAKKKLSFPVDEVRQSPVVYVRSIFLQGLLLMPLQSIPPHLERLRPTLEKLEVLSRDCAMTRGQIAVGYVKAVDGIEKVVVGVDNLEQLKELFLTSNVDLSKDIIEEIDIIFADLPKELIMPNLWKL